MNNLTLFVEHLETETGTITLLTDELDRLRSVDWDDHDERQPGLLARRFRVAPRLVSREMASAARRSLDAYFGGDLGALDTIAAEPNGTPFQRLVWNALREIRPGTTMSYSGLARAIGRPRAVRAVGLANGANPIGIVVPCHRVIGADGSLTGYAGGIVRKQWLLAHERRFALNFSPES